MHSCLICQSKNPASQAFCGTCRSYLGSLGGYRLAQKLGSGGFATVYQGKDPNTGYPVAIKILHPQLQQREAFVRRFSREGQLLKQLDHPFVVRIFDVGEVEELGLYLIMEWLDGKTLSDALPLGGQEPMTIAQIAPWVTQLLLGLEYIHAHQMVHRDIKPSNLMLVEEKGVEVLKILDFGLARSDELEPLTLTHQTMGTPHFMAPELIREGAASQVGPGTDLYAVALWMVLMLTGEYAFCGATTQELLRKQCEEPPPRLAQLCPDRAFPEALEALLQKALAKPIEQRFSSALAMLDAFRKLPGAAFDPAELQASLPTSGGLPTGSAAAADPFGETLAASFSQEPPPDAPGPRPTPEQAPEQAPEQTPEQTPATKLSLQVGDADLKVSKKGSSLEVGLGFGSKFRLTFQIALSLVLVSGASLWLLEAGLGPTDNRSFRLKPRSDRGRQPPKPRRPGLSARTATPQPMVLPPRRAGSHRPRPSARKLRRRAMLRRRASRRKGKERADPLSQLIDRHLAATRKRSRDRPKPRPLFRRLLKESHQKQRTLHQCYALYLRKSGRFRPGTMGLLLHIQPSGRVSSLRVLQPRFKKLPVVRCIVQRSRKWRFASFKGKPVTLVLKYLLQPAQ